MGNVDECKVEEPKALFIVAHWISFNGLIFQLLVKWEELFGTHLVYTVLRAPLLKNYLLLLSII